MHPLGACTGFRQLTLPLVGVESPLSPDRLETTMPHYEFFCHACKKLFPKVLTLTEHEKGEVVCPHCGSDNVEQSWSAFYAITARKSA